MKYNFDIDDRNKKIKNIFKEIIIWTIEILVVVAVAYLLVRYAVEKTTMVGNSMGQTLENGEKIIINKLSYRFTSPKRFDIIVFKQNGKEHSYYNIKRILGLPGEKVLVKDGMVYIDGEGIEEKVEVEKISIPGLAEEEILLDAEEYFVLGDNRNDSEDSRFASIGNVVKGDIVGKAWIRLKPFSFINQIAKEKEDKTTK